MASSGWVQSLKTKMGWPQKMKYSKYVCIWIYYHNFNDNPLFDEGFICCNTAVVFTVVVEWIYF